MATESELRYNAAHFLDSYKGCTEGGTLHKKLVDMFNNSGKCTRYTVTLKDAWCAVAFCDCFIGTGLTDLIPIDCGCAEMITKSKAMGIWQENDAYVPKIGDGILYDWQDTTGSKSDNTGTPDHIGMVQTVSGSSFTVIEGNYSDTVKVRTMQVNGSSIRGFITPDYASAASDGSTGFGTGSGTTSGTGSGTTGSTSSTKLDVDGEIGPKTVSRLQKFCGLTETGKIGNQPSKAAQYWTSILDSVVTWSSGKSDTVRAFQKYLADKGYYTGTKAGFKDGKLGANTAKCAQQFLSDKKYYTGKIDSIFGEKSAMALQSWLNSYK